MLTIRNLYTQLQRNINLHTQEKAHKNIDKHTQTHKKFYKHKKIISKSYTLLYNLLHTKPEINTKRKKITQLNRNKHKNRQEHIHEYTII